MNPSRIVRSKTRMYIETLSVTQEVFEKSIGLVHIKIRKAVAVLFRYIITVSAVNYISFVFCVNDPLYGAYYFG